MDNASVRMPGIVWRAGYMHRNCHSQTQKIAEATLHSKRVAAYKLSACPNETPHCLVYQ